MPKSMLLLDLFKSNLGSQSKVVFVDKKSKLGRELMYQSNLGPHTIGKMASALTT
jgi:hypothetical protein